MADTDGTQQRRKRAVRACEFCRKRKMKCNDEKPQCTNCKLYGKECHYAQALRKVRPLRERLASAEEENRQLQSRLGGTIPSPSATVQNVENSLSNPSRQSEREEDTPPGRLAHELEHNESARIQASASAFGGASTQGTGNQPTYYGRTSALFDEENGDMKAPGADRKAIENTKRQLFGEAAHQKQLETLNFRDGKLDFDSVDPEVGMHLLNLQHHSHLITYRPAFMRDMACQGPYFSKLLLNAIYFGSCKFSPRPELKGIHKRFRERVRELLGGALDRSSITTIQAMLVMTNSLFALGDERSAAWVYAGIAFRMLIDLGAHIDRVNSRLGDEDLEIRRRVFWGAFVVDKIQSLYQGRPVSLRYTDVKVPILFQDQFEELEHWSPFAYPDTMSYPGSPAYSVSTFTELCKLSVIMNSILDKVYGVRSSNRELKTLANDLETMQLDLEQWKAALPHHLIFEPTDNQVAPPPHVLSLHAMYNVLLILLHRPFVSEGHLHVSTSMATNSFSVCAQAAIRTVHLLRVYDRAFSIRHAPYLITYATYVAATIHVRIAAQMGPGSDAYSLLRTCCSVFVKNQDTNWAARRAQTVILKLVKKMNIELNVDNESTPDSEAYRNTSQANNQNLQTPDSVLGVKLSTGSDTTPLNNDSVQYGLFGDVDMNAIIHSFVNDQQSNSVGTIPQETPYMHPYQAEALSNIPQIPPEDLYGQWSVFEFPGDREFEDTLFGFNGAALDGQWQ